MTYSETKRTVHFCKHEIVDMSGLLGAFMGDKSGLNTPYILPYPEEVEFELLRSIYQRASFENGRWTRRGKCIWLEI